MSIHFVEAPNNFYLGARVDPASGDLVRDDVVYYDARFLNTHGVILGMTGSGKTGLAISLLEEAALDDIPILIIDPKGDITNLLLAFPDFTQEYFEPWVNPEDAMRKNMTTGQFAGDIAKAWQSGLAEWGISNDRVQAYRRAARFSIYTPGSDAGLPVSILQSFAAPRNGFDANVEFYRQHVADIVTALLNLIGIQARPVEDPEHVLLSNIVEYNWRHGRDLSVEQLIIQVQQPPFNKLGVMDVETIINEKKRFALAQKLNNILAAPNFQSWIRGEPLDIGALLWTPEGHPRVTIMSIAHLNDVERQFIVTLLMDSILSWMQTQPGSTSLRALVYIDEMFGLMPPYPVNPPSKDPIMRMLKQARAFGVGMLLSTQNPKDLDYKGLSNAGTWFIGKLQTDNDKSRVMEGLDGTRDANSTLDLNTVDRLLNRLQTRQFIYHNVHSPNTPIMIQTRWVMSYLRGPLTREQIGKLMASQKQHFRPQTNEPSHVEAASGSLPSQPAPAPAFAAPPPTYSDTLGGGEPPSKVTAPPALSRPELTSLPGGFSARAPQLPSSVYQFYLPTEYNPEMSVKHWEVSSGQYARTVDPQKRLLYRPALLAQTMVRFDHRATNTQQTMTMAFVVPNIPRVPLVNWAEFQSDPFDPNALDPAPSGEAFYAELPDTMTSGSALKDLQTNLQDWLYHNMAITLFENKPLKMQSALSESRRDFVSRVQNEARMGRDAEIDKIAARYDKTLATLEQQYNQYVQRTEQERMELEARKREELLTGAESVMQLLKGRMYYTLSRSSRMRRYTETSKDQLSLKEQKVQAIVERFQATEYEMEQALQSTQEKWGSIVAQIDEIRVSPYKKDINLMLFGLGWVPYWDTLINGVPVVLPASSSGLAYMQEGSQNAYYGSGGGGGGYDSYDTGAGSGW